MALGRFLAQTRLPDASKTFPRRLLGHSWVSCSRPNDYRGPSWKNIGCIFDRLGGLLVGVFGILKPNSGSHIIVYLEPFERYKNIGFIDGIWCSKFIFEAQILEKSILEGLGGFLKRLGHLLGRFWSFLSWILAGMAKSGKKRKK